MTEVNIVQKFLEKRQNHYLVVKGEAYQLNENSINDALGFGDLSHYLIKNIPKGYIPITIREVLRYIKLKPIPKNPIDIAPRANILEALLLLKDASRELDENKLIKILEDKKIIFDEDTGDFVSEGYKDIDFKDIDLFTQTSYLDGSMYSLKVREGIFLSHLTNMGVDNPKEFILALGWLIMIDGTNLNSPLLHNGKEYFLDSIFPKTTKRDYGINQTIVFRLVGRDIVVEAKGKNIKSWLQNYTDTPILVYPGVEYFHKNLEVITHSLRASLIHRVSKVNVKGQLLATQIRGVVDRFLGVIFGRKEILGFSTPEVITFFKGLTPWDEVTLLGGIHIRTRQVTEILMHVKDPKVYALLI